MMTSSILPRAANLLIAEDESLLSALLERVLTEEGHRVTLASNGREALELLDRQSFDAILSDIAMPEVDGIELLSNLNRRASKVPVILMTGSPTVESALKGIEFHAFHYLPKPFDFDELCVIVARALKEHRTQDEERAELSDALDRFFTTYWMAFQPLVDSTGALFGYEALMRSREPALPHPGAVLDAAEKTERLKELAHHLRERTVRDFKAHAPDGVRLFFNVHPEDLLDEALYDPQGPLASIASRTVLEITERVSFKKVPELHSRIDKLRAMGFSIAVDDLGLGYAGLTSLATLSPDVVKLDMSLIRNVHLHFNQQSIIRCVLSMRESLGFQVVGEGVENVEERDALVELGCDLFQGYFIGRPAEPMPGVYWP